MNKTISTSFALAALMAAAAAQAQAPGGSPLGAGQVSAETIITESDQNTDGIVTKEEAQEANKRLIQAWDRYDLNKDDKVDATEITKAMAAMQAGGDEAQGSGNAPSEAATDAPNSDASSAPAADGAAPVSE